MKVIASHPLGPSRFPIAGIEAGDRFARTSRGAVVRTGIGGSLWVNGLFPLAEEDDLVAFFDFARAGDGPALWPSTDPEHDLLWADETSDVPHGLREDARIFGERPRLFAVTDPLTAAEANRMAFAATARRALTDGVIVLAPELTWIEETVFLESGAIIEPNVTLAGTTQLAVGARICMGCHLRNTTVGPGTLVRPYSVIEDTVIGSEVRIGPFAHLRTGTVLADEVRVGNFVETKKARLGKGTKASHLTYLGDTEIGSDANVGAGTITCNYDGYGKHLTRIGNGVFIGSNSQLVAPVNLGDGAYVAAGSTVTDDVPEDALVIARSRQTIKPDLARVLRERARAQKEKKSASS